MNLPLLAARPEATSTPFDPRSSDASEPTSNFAAILEAGLDAHEAEASDADVQVDGDVDDDAATTDEAVDEAASEVTSDDADVEDPNEPTAMTNPLAGHSGALHVAETHDREVADGATAGDTSPLTPAVAGVPAGGEALAAEEVPAGEEVSAGEEVPAGDEVSSGREVLAGDEAPAAGDAALASNDAMGDQMSLDDASGWAGRGAVVDDRGAVGVESEDQMATREALTPSGGEVADAAASVPPGSSAQHDVDLEVSRSAVESTVANDLVDDGVEDEQSSRTIDPAELAASDLGDIAADVDLSVDPEALRSAGDRHGAESGVTASAQPATSTPNPVVDPAATGQIGSMAPTSAATVASPVMPGTDAVVETTLSRIAETVEAMVNQPPPRSISLDLADMHGIRVRISIESGDVSVSVTDAGAGSSGSGQWERQLHDTLDQRRRDRRTPPPLARRDDIHAATSTTNDARPAAGLRL